MSEVTFEGKVYKDIDMDAQRAFHAVNIHTFRYFPKDRVWMASDSTVEYFGIDKFYKILDDNAGPNIIYSEDREKDLNMYRRVIGGEDVVTESLRSYDGENYYKLTLYALEKDEAGNAVIVAGIIEDYDEQMRSNQIAQILSGDYSSMYLVDFNKDRVTAVRLADYIKNVYGQKMGEHPRYLDIITSYIENEVVAEEQDEMKQLASYENICRELRDKKSFRHDYRVMRDGKPVFFRMKVVNVSEGETVDRVVMGFANIDSDKHIELIRDAYFDQITLGSNFSYYNELLKRETRQGYIVSMDIKAFKVVNDVCGIHVGDKTLQRVSTIVERAVGDSGFYGHVNADHFVFYLSFNDEADVLGVLNNITENIKIMVEEHNLPKISPYYGITQWEPGDRIQVMFSEANTAKHRIKNQKGINYGFYREEDNAAAIEEKRIEDAFDKAVAEKQFVIWYQPKFDPVTDKVVGAEALIRWIKPDGSMVFPNKFIPVYERNGMIRQLDEYVFTSVCEQQKIWKEKIGTIIPISINLSRASLYFDTIVEDYKVIADRIGIPTELVPIEITESAAINNSEIKSIADSFFKAGFPLHMDDFGSGYSSLSTLNMMIFDTLKLDKSLIDYIGEFGGDRLIKHTIALAKDLGLHVTAEGVEESSQVEFLKEVECDSIQGYYYAKPMPAGDFENLMISML